MKNIKNLLNQPTLRCLAIGLAALTLASYSAKANPFASGVTNDSGTIRFTMNETGAVVTVTFEDNSTLAMGTLDKGPTNFLLGAHTSYQISAVKTANGTPYLISSDTYSNSMWANPRGVDCYKDPKKGHLFGRIFVGSGGTGGYGWGTAGFKNIGVYGFKADQTDGTGRGTNSAFYSTFSGSAASGPYRISVGQDDGKVYITDYSTAHGGLYVADPDLTSIATVLDPAGENQGLAAGTHGDPTGCYVKGSLANNDLTVYTFDPALGVPPPPCAVGDNTTVGAWNNLFRYEINGGPLAWTNAPNFGVNMGLAGFFDSQMGDVTFDPHTGYLIGMFRRANFSDGNIQIFSQPDGQRLYTSLRDVGGGTMVDVFTGSSTPGTAGNGAYGGVRVSPDGRFIATININNIILVANLVNGIPDESSLVTIANTPSGGNARGIAFDAADNIWECSSGQLLLRCYSLGISSTTVYSNDWTGTNGSFSLVIPDVNATVDTTTSLASQNYVNNTVGAGTPIPGVFKINLNKSTLSSPVVVTYALGGTAGYSTNATAATPVGNYTVWGITNNVNLYTNSYGVIFTTNTVTFPANAPYPGGGNWQADLNIIPTKTPYFGPSYTVTIRLGGGANYIAGTPLAGTISIQNTGPQVLFLAAATAAQGPTMNRGIPRDYARFVVTRWGDTNGPGNSVGNVNPKQYTHNNFFYSGTAVYPTDYTAKEQRLDSFATTTLVPADGSHGITINPGEVTVAVAIGNPVKHTIVSVPPTNVTIIINQTNGNTANLVTNYTSPEGYPYFVTTNNPVTLTEVDNAVGLGGVVLWSNPLTNAADSVNWTLTFASTNLFGVTTNPVVIANYSNAPVDPSLVPPGGGNYEVQFGYPIANDGIPPSDTMLQNGWTNALRMTCNKDFSYPSASGVNVFPQGQKFAGNYALRFDMYLSLNTQATNNPNIGTYVREFAAFGVNHTGTNCMWRMDAPIPLTQPGSGMTNFDGIWFCIDADVGSQTPADFDGFISPPLPNAGVPSDFISAANTVDTGIFKKPPFPCRTAAGGQPVDKWVDVSVELFRQTNCTLLVDRAGVFNPGNAALANFFTTNRGIYVSPGVWVPTYTNGTIMLGYIDPIKNVSDESSFVYYSNVRVVELSPYILVQPVSMLVTQGATFNLTNSANLATAPLTNMWYRSTTNIPATLTSLMLSNSVNATNLTTVLGVTNILNGTNYTAVFSDSAGAVQSIPAIIEVIAGPTNAVAIAGANFQWLVRATGNAGPAASGYWWKTNGVNLATNAHYTGVSTTNLWITNVVAADAGTYSVGVTNVFGTVAPAATLTVISPITTTQSLLWGQSATFTVPTAGPTPAYQWKKNNVNITGANGSSLTLANVTSANAGTYTCGVTNGLGILCTNGVLMVSVPPPVFANGTNLVGVAPVTVGGGNVVLAFSSPNNLYDTTNAFMLLQSPVVLPVSTPWTTNTSAVWTTNGASPPMFQVTVPDTGGNMFYKLQHVP